MTTANTEEIADILGLTARLMELHEENPFKIKSLSNAAFRLSKTQMELHGLTQEELEKIEGIGKSIAAKIIEIQQSGTTRELQQLLEKTPAGVVEMLDVKGIGPKKVAQLWNELHIESVGELLYACYENRLLDLKGFGVKTQDTVKKAIEFKMANAGKFHYAAIEKTAMALVEKLKKELHTQHVSLTGEIRRKNEVLDKIEILLVSPEKLDEMIWSKEAGIHVKFYYSNHEDYYYDLLQTSSAPAHLEGIQFSSAPKIHYSSETALYKQLNLPYVEPELREGFLELEALRKNELPGLIDMKDLKGVLHNHTKYSDGLNTLEEMAQHCKTLGYEYLGICDHSKTAVYANGLSEERIIEQHREIEQLNKKLAPFKILKGIESDILNDGSLDYTVDILKSFDFIVASVHQNLKMTEEKATSRLIKAIENPYTSILGHPTGRLLLGRPGYPIHHKKIIDACAANGVVIELNAHPYRLDIDWRWIPYCMEKGVKVSINPDAHEKHAYHDMYYGVCVARKGMLTSNMCFNAMNLQDVEAHFLKRRGT